MLLQLCLSSCSAVCSSCGRKICGWQSPSQSREWGRNGISLRVCFSNKLQLKADTYHFESNVLVWQHLSTPAKFSWALSGNCCQSVDLQCWLLLHFCRWYHTVCLLGAPACSCTRQPSHRGCFQCTVLPNWGDGIVMLKRKQKHGSVLCHGVCWCLCTANCWEALVNLWFKNTLLTGTDAFFTCEVPSVPSWQCFPV